MTVARQTTYRCDVCGKETDQIVGKLNFVPVLPGISKSAHSNYSHSADVGTCCGQKVLRVIKFRKRMTMDEYQAVRKGIRIRQRGAA